MSRHSIRFRLTLWYSLALAIALGLFGALMWLSMRRQLYREIDSALATRAARFEAYVVHESAETSTADQLQDELEEFSQGLPASDIADLSGSQGFTFHFPPASRPTLPATATRPMRSVERTFVADGETFRLRLSTSTEDARHTLGLLSELLFGLMPVAIAISCLVGIWLSRRALKPVDDVTRAARSIGIDNLSERLPLPGTGDELQRLTETWNEMLTRLDGAVSTLSQFAADASHELRTPLAVIRTSAELALRRARTPEEYRDAILGIEEESERMGKLVENLLYLARSEARLAELPKEPVDLRLLAEQATRELGSVAEARGVRIRVVPGDEVFIAGNRPALERLLLVLLDNAVKYSPAGADVVLKLTSDGNSPALSVHDFGPGIAPADLPHIFKRFYRADPSRTTNSATAGFGLGLALAEAIATAHNATLDVASAPGAGTTFRVTFSNAVPAPDRLALTA